MSDGPVMAEFADRIQRLNDLADAERELQRARSAFESAQWEVVRAAEQFQEWTYEWRNRRARVLSALPDDTPVDVKLEEANATILRFCEKVEQDRLAISALSPKSSEGRLDQEQQLPDQSSPQASETDAAETEPQEAHMILFPENIPEPILAERKRQIEAEGWTPEHDDEHGPQILLQAAQAYRLHEQPAKVRSGDEVWHYDGLTLWPWDEQWWKPKSRRRNLEKAGALALAARDCAQRVDGPGVYVGHINYRLNQIIDAYNALEPDAAAGAEAERTSVVTDHDRVDQTNTDTVAAVEIPEGFTAHDGSDHCPFAIVGDKPVEWINRHGMKFTTTLLKLFWDSNVKAYRIISEPAEASEPAEIISTLTGDPAIEPESGLHGEPLPPSELDSQAQAQPQTKSEQSEIFHPDASTWNAGFEEDRKPKPGFIEGAVSKLFGVKEPA